MGVKQIGGKVGGWQEMVMHSLLEALQGKLGLNTLGEAVPQMVERRNERVEVGGKY